MNIVKYDIFSVEILFKLLSFLLVYMLVVVININL